MKTIVMLTMLLISLTKQIIGTEYCNSSINEFVNIDKWNVIKGTWTYNVSDCSITHIGTNTMDQGDRIWLGTANGSEPDHNYEYESFILESSFIITSDDILDKVGYTFRSQNQHPITSSQGGDFYLLNLFENSNNNQPLGVAFAVRYNEGNLYSPRSRKVTIWAHNVYTIK
eukprot:244350_1